MIRLTAPLALALMMGLLATALLGTVQAPVALANGTPRYVSTAGSDTGDCSGSPCATIHYAVNQSVAGDRVKVAAGVYTQTGVVITQSVTIQGAGLLSTIVQAHTNPLSATGRVFGIPGGQVVTITQMTVRHGKVSGLSDLGYGGGIWVAGRLALQDVSVGPNSARHGGGLGVNGGHVTLIDTQIVSNTAEQSGGGVYIYSGTVVLNGGLILSNTAYHNSGGGGGVCVFGGAFTQTGASVIAYNRGQSGGGLLMRGEGGRATLSGA